MGVRRDGEMRALKSDDYLIPGDDAIVAVSRQQVNRVLQMFGKDRAFPNKVVIGGAGNVGQYVARRLEEAGEGISVRLIENDRDRAQQAAESLKNAIVVYGDGLHEDIMHEVGISKAQMYLGLTNDDETNILSSVLASELGDATTIALVNQPQYPRFARRLGVDAFLNPRTVTVSKILRHVRRGRIRGVYTLYNGAAELIEAEALETSPLVGRPLKDVELGDDVRIGAIIRGGEMQIPTGQTRVEAGDLVIVFALADAVRKVEQMFRVSIDFF